MIDNNVNDNVDNDNSMISTDSKDSSFSNKNKYILYGGIGGGLIFMVTGFLLIKRATNNNNNNNERNDEIQMEPIQGIHIA